MVRADQREDAIEKTSNALKMAAAKLMFDDYQTLGVFNEDSMFGETRHAIHMFLLDGIYVPSSEVFNSMAEAAKQVLEGNSKKEDTHAAITLPGPITDNGPKWPEIREQSQDDATFKELLYEHWKEEYQKARAAITWHASFTLRIKDILSKATGVTSK